MFCPALSDANRVIEENALECKYAISETSTAPAVPTGLTGSPGNRLVSLTWSGSSAATGYNLVSSTTPDGPFTSLAMNLTANNFVDTNAVIGKTNYYEVAAANGCSVSANSASIAVYSPQPALSVATVSGGTLNLAWPMWASNWGLYYTTTLTPPVVWLPVTNAVSNN